MATGMARAEMKLGGPPTDHIFYMVKLEPPTGEVSFVAKSEEEVFSQPFHSIKAVRVQEGITLPYVATGKNTAPAIDFEKPASPQVTIPAGAILVMALGTAGEYYCGAGVAREDSHWSGSHDAGVCLRDADHDNVFEIAQATDLAPKRVRVAYEMNCLCHTTDTAIHVPYTVLEDRDIPRGKLKVAYRYYKPFISGHPTLSYGLCWPPELIASTADENSGRDCAATQWAAPRIDLDRGHAADVQWGPVKLTVTRNTDNSVTVQRLAAADPGNVLIVQTAYRYNQDPMWQEAIFSIRKMVAKSDSDNPQGQQ